MDEIGDEAFDPRRNAIVPVKRDEVRISNEEADFVRRQMAHRRDWEKRWRECRKLIWRSIGTLILTIAAAGPPQWMVDLLRSFISHVHAWSG
jgi:hypothetical protein